MGPISKKKFIGAVKKVWYHPMSVRIRQRGDIYSVEPTSRFFGGDRGQIIDRYYIEKFLHKYSKDIKGRVLEVADDSYTKKFGGSKVEKTDVLHVDKNNQKATIIGDLASGKGIPKDAFDCMIVTQTYHVIYDIHSAVRNSHMALKPGGVLLATIPCVSQISRYDMDKWGDYWRLTSAAAKRLFGDIFGPENVTVEIYGNALTCCAFIHGLAVEDLKKSDLEYNDPDYELLVVVRAVKSLKKD